MLVYSQSRSEGRCDISLHSARRYIKHYAMPIYRAVKTPRLGHHLTNKMKTYIETTEPKFLPV